MIPDSPTLVVLAAGLGSRYGGLKQLDPMGPKGEPLLDYAVFDALRAGFRRVVFVIRREFSEAFESGIGARYRQRIPVAYAFQELADVPAGFSVPAERVRPWGTLHAVLAARTLIDGSFAVINADDFYGADAYIKLARFLTLGSNGTCKHLALVGYPLRATLSASGGVNRGVCRERNGYLTGVEEHLAMRVEGDGLCYGTRPTGERVPLSDSLRVSMNCWGFPSSVLAGMACFFDDFLRRHGESSTAECYIPSFVDALVSSGEGDCRVLETTANWFGITYPEDKPDSVRQIRKLIDEGAYPEALWG